MPSLCKSLAEWFALKVTFDNNTVLALCLWHYQDVIRNKLKSAGMTADEIDDVMHAFWIMSKCVHVPVHKELFLHAARLTMITTKVPVETRRDLLVKMRGS